ncbi:MAG: type II toxin-antitoxin system VapB family antitoxin [Gemmatimonas sp.]
MKTAISLPDDLFTEADVLAKSLGKTRSRLVAEALAEYVAKHRHAEVTERLNAVYAVEDGRLDPYLAEAARRTLAANEW